MNGGRISLLIPTKNRPDFLARLLRYYWTLGFRGTICIGDSSDSTHTALTKQAILVLKDRLNIIYREYPGIDISECLARLVELVPTPYAAFVADDDFLVPASLDKCANFLDSHSDYAAAHGRGVAIRLKPSGVYGKIESIIDYQQQVLEADTASQRLIDHLNNYTTTLFSVHRIESWREMFRDITALEDRTFACEMLPCCLSVILGKAKELDCFYLVRQGHDLRYLLPLKADWLAGPTYQPSYQIYLQRVSQAISRQDGIAVEQARDTVEQAFSAYLATAVVEPVSSRYGIPRLLQMGKRVPGAKYVWRASRWVLRRLKVLGREELPLSQFTDPSSPYYTDFIPVQRSMSGELGKR